MQYTAMNLVAYLILLEESTPVVGLDELLGLRVAQSDPVIQITEPDHTAATIATCQFAFLNSGIK
jgi:hypothetical protein